MRAIKHTLTERYYAWEDALELAESDPEVDLSGEGAAYTPMEYLEEYSVYEDESAGEAEDRQTKSASAPTNVDPSTLPPKDKPAQESPRL